MKLLKTDFPGLVIIEPDVFEDHRGYFMEVHHQQKFADLGLKVNFVQDNMSRSPKNALRGLHYQLKPHGMGKLVRVPEGKVFDVAVDIRQKSPTYGKWWGGLLSDENKRAVFVPEGFAHGFCVLSESAVVYYKCTALYNQESERGLRWDDPQLAIEWPLQPDLNLLSKKDKTYKDFDQVDTNFSFS